MFYSITISDTATKERLQFLVSSDVSLNDQQLLKLKGLRGAIFEKRGEWSRLVEANKILSVIPTSGIASSDTLNMTVRKIRNLDTTKTLLRTREELYQKCVQKEPDAPLKFLWSFFVAPFLALYRFYTQDRTQKLHKLFGTEVQQQKQLVSQLKRMKKALAAGSVDIGPSSQAPIWMLQRAIERGKQITSMLSSKNGDVHLNVEKMTNDLVSQLVRDGSDGAFELIPISLLGKDTRLPYFVSLKRVGNEVQINFNNIFTQTAPELQESYVVSTTDPSKAKTALKYILKAILMAGAAQKKSGPNEHLLGYRERIQKGNMQYQGIPWPKETQKNQPFEPLKDLHEILSNFSAPYKVKKVDSALQRDPIIEFFHELEASFPQAAVVDRVEWLLTSFLEEEAAFFDSIDKISLEDEAYFFEHLERKISALQKYIQQNCPPDQEIPPLFRAFQDKLKKAKSHRIVLNQKLAKMQVHRLQAFRAPAQKCTTQIDMSLTKLSDTTHTAKKQRAPGPSITHTNQTEIAALKQALANNHVENSLKILSALHKASDLLIENKEYLAARELAMQVLHALPIPSPTEITFWNHIKDKSDKNTYSEVMTDLVKDVWESSMRLAQTAPQPEDLIQLFKAQIIQVTLARDLSIFKNCTVDYREMLNIIHLHPHHRFGWKPSMEKELKQIECFLRAEENSQQRPIRCDGHIGVETPSIPKMLKRGTQKDDANFHTDFARMQVMVSSLMKPVYCFSLFFGADRLSQIKGLSWLDQQRETVKAKGAKTDEEIKDAIKVLRLEQVQNALHSMKRLELSQSRFVTEHPCITIVDSTTHTQKPILAYLPNGYGLPENFENYTTANSEKNTEELVGTARGVSSFLEISDKWNGSGVDKRNVRGLLVENQTSSSLRDSLTPQRGFTEPTLLQIHLQTPPKGQISQLENYQLSSCAIGASEAGPGCYDTRISEKTIPGSVVEAFNILFGEKNLSQPEVQRTILLILTRPFLLETALSNSPKQLLAIAHQLKGLVVKYQNDSRVFPFLLQIGQILHDYSLEVGDSCKEITDEVPCFDHRLPKMQEKILTGKEWLEEVLQNPDQDHAPAAIAYLYALMDRPIDSLDNKTVGCALLAASYFGAATHAVGLPMFNEKVKHWVNHSFLPIVAQDLQSEKLSLDLVCKDWIGSLLSKEQALGPWKAVSWQPVTIENTRLRITFSPLQIVDRTTGKLCNLQKAPIPADVRSSQQFLHLFGNIPISAEIEYGQSSTEYIYSFQFGGHSYRVIYDQATAKMEIFGRFPPLPNAVSNKEAWYQFCSVFTATGKTSFEELMQTKGLWIRTDQPAEGYLFTGSLSQAPMDTSYCVSLKKDGSVKEAHYRKNGCQVAVMSQKEIEKLLPFANGLKTVVLTSSKRKVEEIHCLDQGRVFTLVKGEKWVCQDARLDPTWHWVTDSTRFDDPLQGSHEKAFFDSLGSDADQVILTITKEGKRQYILLPYELQIPHKGSTQSIKESIAGLKAEPLMTLTFGKEGELQGTPSSLLYLSYYFAMRKDYERAYFYLEKATKMPAQSEAEKTSFQHVANLFTKIPYRSSLSVLFQLKAQLRIREITRTQFSEVVYHREQEEQFLVNAKHVSLLYHAYLQYPATSASYNQKFLPKLSVEELEILESIPYGTLYPWEKAQQESLGPIPARIQEINQENFLNTRIDASLKAKISAEILFPAVLLARHLDRTIGVEQLIKKGRPDTEQMLFHFYHFYDAIQRDSAKANIDQILSYLLATPEWEISPTKTLEGKENANYANQMRLALVVFCLNQKQQVPQALPVLRKGDLRAAQKKLPYWDRLSSSPISVLLRFRDQDLRAGEKLKDNLKFSGVEDISQQINLIIDLPDFKNKTFGELLGMVDLSAPQQKRPESGFSLGVVEKYLKELADGDRSHLPIEKEEILRLIDQEKDVEKNKVREVLTIVRESESRGFSLLDIRMLAENMQAIETLTKRMPKIEKRGEKRDVAFLLGREVSSLHTTLKTESAPFSRISESVQLLVNASVEKLNQQCLIAEKHFSHEGVENPALQEEYRQIKMGLSAAKKFLEQELQQKTSFTSDEQKLLQAYLLKHLFQQDSEGTPLSTEQGKETVVQLYKKLKDSVLEGIKGTKPEDLPSILREMRSKPDLYTDFDLLHAVENLYKQIPMPVWLSKNNGQMDVLVTKFLLLKTTHQQLQHAWQEWQKNPSEKGAAKALEYIQQGLQLDRYSQPGQEVIYRKCLVGEARGEIIYRPGQRELIQSIITDPQQWLSLRMGLGKTSYALPTIAEILSATGRSVVLTVPEKLLKSNRKDLDRTTRTLFDQAGVEFSLPLKKNLSLSYLSEKVLQVQKVFKDKGYVITSVEELATLQNTCILLEEEKRKFCQLPATAPFSDEQRREFCFMELRLHYYRKLYRLLSGAATELNLPGIFFGDEADDTHHVAHEVNIALGEKVDLSKTVSEASHVILETILSATPESSLAQLKEGLVRNTYPVLTPKEIQKFMEEVAKKLLQSDAFLGLCGDRDKQELLKQFSEEEWANYLTGISSTLPKGLPPWNPKDERLCQTQKLIGAVKQLLTSTLPSFLAQKSGNDFGLSDYEGFSVVPKVTRNETRGMRYGDEFEMVLAQYLGYLEYAPSLSLSDAAPQFLEEAVKNLKEKSPSAYRAMLDDYNRFSDTETQAMRAVPSLLDYLKLPQACKHRWVILEEIVIAGGYIKRYKEQVRTNVQEIFHKKACGGITGTLDPYVLPFISDEVQLRTSKEAESVSTRLVEAETFLRLGMNHTKGLDQPIFTYQDEHVLQEVNTILKDPETTALINSSGETSEGMDTLAWVAHLRQLSHGKERSYLFLHPKERIYYLWVPGKETCAVPYQRGQSLPKGVVCLYAPSDVRGVDLPIQKGKAHMLGSSTATPQELVQTLYRCRQLGGDHQLMYHLPQSLTDKLQDKTYGGAIRYLIERSQENTLQTKLQAQILKIQLDVKTAITDFLIEINPDLDDRAKMSTKGFKKIGLNAIIQQNFFEAVRSLYIQEKEIDFSVAYQPRVLISGKQKILDTFKATKDQIKTLKEKITEAGSKNLQFQLLQPGVLDEWQKEIGALSTSSLVQPLLLQEFSPFLFLMINKQYTLIDWNQFFLALSRLQLSLKNKIEIFSNSTSTIGASEEQIEELVKWEAMTREIIYGKGKTALYHTLASLETHLDERARVFEQNFAKFHVKHLPEYTPQTTSGSTGCSEQVKELQQEKAQALPKESEDPEQIRRNMQLAPRFYKPLRLLDLIPNEYGQTEQLENESPFNQILISQEARDVLNVLPQLKGDPLVYFAVDTTDPKNPVITLISKVDYHRTLQPALLKDPDLYENLVVYFPTPTGFRWVNGGANKNISDPISPIVQQRLLTAKVYLGYQEEFISGDQEIEKWKKSLNKAEKEELLEHIRSRGSASQGMKFRALLKS